MNFNLYDIKGVKEDINPKWRVVFIYFFLAAIFGFIIINLFDLQIVNGEQNLIRARNISQQESIIRAQRGVIYDSQKEILAKNTGAYTLYITPSELEREKEEEILTKLASIMNVDAQEIIQTYRSKAYDEKGESTGTLKVTITNDLTYDQYIGLLVKNSELTGVHVVEETRRSYPYGESFSHILGYVGDINEKEVERTGLDPNADIGKEGIEASYDEILRGKDGREVLKQDNFSGEEKTYVSESPVNGNNLVLTIDLEWQKKLEQELGKRAQESDSFGGAAVIMESGTGDIKAMVSYPSYDNNLFAKGIKAKDFEELNTDPSTPLVNRVIALQLPTGSIFKPMAAAAALQEGVINSSTQYQSGCVELPLYKLCEADRRYLGTMTVVEGLGRSSNVFFCKTGLAMTEKADGIRTLIKYTDQFGIGKLTGIKLPGEQAGTMASPELKMARQKEPWYLADICNTVIGQGLVTATPLQMTSVASAIANDGKIYRPNLVERVESQNGEVVQEHQPELIREVPVSKENFALIKRGMHYAVNGQQGSAWALSNSAGDPYAKTGSADATEYRNGKKVDGAHSWVMGGFEHAGKDYVFVVHLQEGGRGFQSVPVMVEFLEWLNK